MHARGAADPFVLSAGSRVGDPGGDPDGTWFSREKGYILAGGQRALAGGGGLVAVGGELFRLYKSDATRVTRVRHRRRAPVLSQATGHAHLADHRRRPGFTRACAR